jgi:hypothetical protein
LALVDRWQKDRQDFVKKGHRLTEGKGAGKGKGFCLKSKVKGLKSKDKSQKTKV